PVGPYIVDFYCAQLKLVVELDGETHLGREKNDEERDAWLNQHGFKVVRFWNPLVYEDREAVEDTIWPECEERMVEKKFQRKEREWVPLPPRGRGVRGEGDSTRSE